VEPATLHVCRAMTLFLFSDTILLAEHVASSLRFVTWVSVLDVEYYSTEERCKSMHGVMLHIND
jgi:hypothetical protein